MAAVDIRADNSILNTVTGDHPLFRLEGQDQLERLRDRIRWVGPQGRLSSHQDLPSRRDRAGRRPAEDLRPRRLDAGVPADGRRAHAGRPEVPPAGRRDGARLEGGPRRPEPRRRRRDRPARARMPRRSPIRPRGTRNSEPRTIRFAVRRGSSPWSVGLHGSGTSSGPEIAIGPSDGVPVRPRSARGSSGRRTGRAGPR